MPLETNPKRKRTAIIEQIIRKIPHQTLAHYPTPLVPGIKMGNLLRDKIIWFKRDDLISFGLGGNKIRGLEVILSDAMKRNSDVFITGAGVQSNHVRATAFAAAHAGMASIAVYWGKPPKLIDGNYRVTKMLGAEIRFTGDNDRASVDSHILQIAAELRKEGKRPYPVPRGGACAMGVLGHVLAVIELYRQCEKLGITPHAVIMPVGSGGTYAGWLIGIRLLHLPWKLICYTVSREPDHVSQQVATLAREAAGFLGLDWRFLASDAPVQGGFIGQGYGIPSPEAANAIKLTALAEGILLDPVYTGKTMAGFLDGVEKGYFDGYKNVVFLHTGGEPSFFAGDGDWLLDSRSA